MNRLVDSLPGLEELSLTLLEGPVRPSLRQALDLLVGALGATGGLAHLAGRLEGAAGFPQAEAQDLVLEPSLELSAIAEERREPLFLEDIRKTHLISRGLGQTLRAQACASAIVWPLSHRSRSFGSVCLWWPTTEALSNSELSFFGHVCQMLALALERDHRPQTAEGSLASLGELNRLASLGMQLDASLEALRAPASAMLLQLDEVQRQVADLHMVADPHDGAVLDCASELQQTLDEMSSAAALVNRELTRLADLSEQDQENAPIELSQLLREVSAVARPELEQRGLTLREYFSSEVQLHGNHRVLVQLLLALVFGLARMPKGRSYCPGMELILRKSGSRATISGQLLSVGNGDFGEEPDFSSEVAALCHKTKTGLQLKPSGFELSFDLLTTERSPRSTTHPGQKRILVIDDDPLFLRGLRRALYLHEVRLCATAAEAEIALSRGEFVPDLIVCDLWLPGASGRTLHERIRENLPDLAARFIFVSGAPLSPRDEEYFVASGCRSLRKPIQVEDLLGLPPDAALLM